jgi:predicted TIM-barrel fold metal-dependent hydrolase
MPNSFKIDAHVHVFTTDMPLIDNPRHAPNYSFTHEALIATLDENGVDRAVIAAASPWGDYNDYILAALRAHPKRLRGTAIFNNPVERFALEAMSRDGFVGMRLPFIGLPKLPDVTTFNYRALFRRLADLDWHVHPHVEGEDLPKILPTLLASGVKIVVDHLGRPDPKSGINSEGFKALLRAIDAGRTWVKVSGGYRLGPQAKQYARELLRVAGPACENFRHDGARALLQRRVSSLAHSGLMPAARTTLPHFSVSSEISLPNSAGEPGIGSPPMAASRAFMPGSEIAALISLLSLSTISTGVFFGAAKPYHWLAS